MNDFTILHLSDLHIDESKGRPNILLENLITDIKSEMQYSDNIIIVVTGDLVNRANYRNKKRVIQFFVKLKKCLKEKVKHIYIVPGNHDKVRSEIDEMILCSYGMNKTVDNENQWRYVKTAFEDYLDLVEKIYDIFYNNGSKERVLRDTFGVNIDNINGKNICFVQFNTAWLSKGDQDQRKLKIGEFQLHKIKEDFAENYEKLGDNKKIDLTIALAHHPINWLTGSEEDLLQQEMLSPNSLNANVYICGHTHDRDVMNWQNNRNSLTTLVSGLGWPDGSTSHPYAHTYSSYVFNLDVNSIDVYVRSSDDAYTFEPDFRIYTNVRNKEYRKIVMPIDICKTQSYFNLGAPLNRSSKACFITEDIIKDLNKYSQIYTICEDKLRDRLESIKYDILREIKENCDENFYKFMENVCFFGHEIDLSDLNHDIRTIFMDHLTNYLEAICKIFCDTIISYFPKAEVRIHFRCLDLESDKYCQITHYGHGLKDYIMEALAWGQLIERAYMSRCPLIASVNKQYCSSSFDKNGRKGKKMRWSDFITVIPGFSDNVYIEKELLTEKIIKERPYLTFGVTVYREHDRMILYMLDVHEIHMFIGRQILKFFKYFPVCMKQYAIYLKDKRGD